MASYRCSVGGQLDHALYLVLQLDECSAFWGERERVVGASLVLHMQARLTPSRVFAQSICRNTLKPSQDKEDRQYDGYACIVQLIMYAQCPMTKT